MSHLRHPRRCWLIFGEAQSFREYAYFLVTQMRNARLP